MPSVRGRLVGEVGFDAVNEAADCFGFLDVAALFDGLFDRGLFLSQQFDFGVNFVLPFHELRGVHAETDDTQVEYIAC